MAERDSKDVGSEKAISRFLPGVKPENTHLSPEQHEEIRIEAARDAFEIEQGRQRDGQVLTDALEFRIAF